MPCFILCQQCGRVYDTENAATHYCESVQTGFQGVCSICDIFGADMLYDGNTQEYEHRDLRECLKMVLRNISHTESHCLENDNRFTVMEESLTRVEKKLSEYLEGRKAAVEATIERRTKALNQSSSRQ